jgi:hypothetical protein
VVFMSSSVFSVFYLVHDGFLLGLLVNPEEGGDMFHQNFGDFQLITWRCFREDRTLQQVISSLYKGVRQGEFHNRLTFYISITD